MSILWLQSVGRPNPVSPLRNLSGTCVTAYVQFFGTLTILACFSTPVVVFALDFLILRRLHFGHIGFEID